MPALSRLAALLLVLALAGCGGALPPERQLELTVTAAGYDQPRLEAQVGDQIFIRLRNRDTIAHNLVVDLPAPSASTVASPATPSPPSLSLRPRPSAGPA